MAGEKGIDPKTGKIVPGGIVAETKQTLENIKAILGQAGASLDNAVSSTVHMTDLKEFQQMNEAYAEYFKKEPPGRTTVQVSALPRARTSRSLWSQLSEGMWCKPFSVRLIGFGLHETETASAVQGTPF